MKMENKAIFFDRDGVLNHAIIKNGKPYPPSSLSELRIPDDAFAALQRLKSANFLLIGATNQPDVARGMTTRTTVEEINYQLITHLPLDEIRVCYHDDSDQCFCRKPLPGLLVEAAKQYGIDLKNSVMIGDRWKDIEAGHQAGCKTIWLECDYGEKKPSQPADFTAASLTEAAQWILSTVAN